MKIIYVLWKGDTPDKGVATDDLETFGVMREMLQKAGVPHRYALLPILSGEDQLTIINQMIAENL